MNRRMSAPAAAGIMTSRILAALVLFAAVAGAGLPGAKAYGESANADYKLGQAAEAREDYDAAFDDIRRRSKRIPRMRASKSRSHGCG